MATSIASQLQAIKSLVVSDSEPQKRPFSRPSILFQPTEAADIDVETIYSIALTGLDVLISTEERFSNYKNDLFSPKSRDLDRELMGIDENNRINSSISSYLRLLSGYFELPSSLKTLEYLIRRYKIHVYNMEELILCSLPYHDTHTFVRIIQLLDTGNTRWRFLDGVKNTSAPPPRKVIVQQCLRDMGVLETLCEYATPTKKVQPSVPVIGFCTAVVVEVLGSLMTIDSDVVKRILPYVTSGLQHRGKRGDDQKAGALMIVSLLADKVALSPNVVRSLIRFLADVSSSVARDSTDVQWFRMSFMALVNLVQLQAVELIPKKSMDILNEIRDVPEILSGLTEEFNIDKFLGIFLDSLLEYSFSDELFHQTLIVIIENVPVKRFVDRIVTKILNTCARLYKNRDSTASNTGNLAEQIVASLHKKYPSELRNAVNNFLQSKKEGSNHEMLSRMLDGNKDFSQTLLYSKLWFSLEHPKAEIRRSAILGLDVPSLLKEKAASSLRFGTIQDALSNRLYDDDLSVVKAVLNVEALAELVNPSFLQDALQNVLQRCIGTLGSSSVHESSLAVDVAVGCLQHSVSSCQGIGFSAKKFAALVFPLILIFPKTHELNAKALGMAREINWPLYTKLACVSEHKKILDASSISSVNAENVHTLATTLLMHLEEYLPWMVECCNASEQSTTLFLLVLLDLLTLPEIGDQSLTLFNICFPILKTQWEMLKSSGNVTSASPFNVDTDGGHKRFLERMDVTKIKELNAEILVSVFWRLLETFISNAPEDVLLDKNEKWVCSLQDLHVFFMSQSKHTFKRHHDYLVTNCKISPSRYLSKFFTEEGHSAELQIESLHSFSYLCSQTEDSLAFQLFAEFPSVLVPLSNDNQCVRMAAMSCIEALQTMWSRVNFSKYKNGLSAVWVDFLGDLLALIVQQKKLIISDMNVLPSFLASLLSSSNQSLLVQHNIGKRFDQKTKDKILVFIVCYGLGLSAYAKLRILSLLKGLGSVLMHIAGVKSHLCELLKRRCEYHLGYDKSYPKLSKEEVSILCLLLDICTGPSTSIAGKDLKDPIMMALQFSAVASEDPAVVEPCLTVLRNLTNSLFGMLETATQEILFRDLVCLFRAANSEIQDASKGVLLRIDISCSIVARMLDYIICMKTNTLGSADGRRKKKGAIHQDSDVCGLIPKAVDPLAFTSSLLDILLLKKNLENRISLLGPLFKLLHKVFMESDWNHFAAHSDTILPTSENSQNVTVINIQQTLLLLLEDITTSAAAKDNVVGLEIELLIRCARSTTNSVTCNHVLSLLSTIAKVMPNRVLDHILDILIIVGETTVTQWDSYSQHVFEDLISSIVPCWLSKTDSIDNLLQIFVSFLPEVAEHRRLSIVMHLLKNLGVDTSLGALFFLLFRSLISKKHLACTGDASPLSYCSSSIRMEWEYTFAVLLSEQYDCFVWLPSIAILLQKIGTNCGSEEMFMILAVAEHFTSDKLQNPEIAFKLDTRDISESLQPTIGAIFEHMVSHLLLVESKKHQMGTPIIRKELRENIRSVLKAVSKCLRPPIYFNIVVQLLENADINVKKKALGILCDTVKSTATIDSTHGKKELTSTSRNPWVLLDEAALEVFSKMCLVILKFIDDSGKHSSSHLKVAAVSTIEVLALRYPSDNSVFHLCLSSICKSICTDNSSVSSGCLRATGALVNVLGPKALPELPCIMGALIQKFRSCSKSAISICEQNEGSLIASSEQSNPVFMSILVSLDAVVDKLGGFLSPHLGDILELLVLCPQYTSTSDVQLKLKADDIRKLIASKVPVRLSLSPLLTIYPDAIRCGECSLSIAFKMLGDVVATMDRSTIGAYHVKIFDMCLQALDLRRQHLASVKNVELVEKSVINTMVGLSMKLTESMFRPLFIKSIEWSNSNAEENETKNPNDRIISFYGLVNMFTENHRSLFVPYFKYLLEDCVRHLKQVEDGKDAGTQKKKKAKRSETKDADCGISVGAWHLRALILSSLHKCFLYDNGIKKFLDSSNFQVLLQPIVSQLDVDPPLLLEQNPSVPSVEEVDDLLVSCISQMAVTSGSDLLWKPLNHEVLMHTRSNKLRTRILGLRVVRQLVQSLKEEYLQFLAETIPFLGELLEDEEPSVKSLAQEILREMESLSGESIRQYL
ncbi:hypothetical protein DM860_016508 [Cuscuta australis]|uniref:BP28 C-terminal domain-containing protein n=1 Tax=Cuscuta australis TaxID=267555 RepID=A0A328E394_9ASTE|nr:hypothetical protein DM860_016508 [Cuscuta australis]